MKRNKLYLPITVSLIVFVILSVVQLKSSRPLIILERFVANGGWIEILAISIYSAILTFKMSDPAKQAKWRIRSWTIFSVAFFLQLILGLAGIEKFLMTGDLHLPVPMMIIGGPAYRFEITFMPILFFSTVILSGPAWCSQLCYFGAIDAKLAARKKKGFHPLLRNLTKVKVSALFLVIITAIVLRLLKVPVFLTTILAGSFGILGIVLMILFSGRTGRMVNCLVWCPVGTLVNYVKHINPFRFRISDTCTSCMRCIPVCKYGALSQEDIEKRKPGITCTLCGDCTQVCKPGSLHYKFPGMGPMASRNLYLGITIVLHAVFLALARM